MLSGSWDCRDQLKIWDLRTFEVSESIEYKNTYVYSCKFLSGVNWNGADGIIASGSNNNQVSVFSLNAPKSNSDKETLESQYINTCTTKYMGSACYKADYSNNSKLLVSAWADGCVRSYNIFKNN